MHVHFIARPVSRSDERRRRVATYDAGLPSRVLLGGWRAVKLAQRARPWTTSAGDWEGPPGRCRSEAGRCRSEAGPHPARSPPPCTRAPRISAATRCAPCRPLSSSCVHFPLTSLTNKRQAGRAAGAGLPALSEKPLARKRQPHVFGHVRNQPLPPHGRSAPPPPPPLVLSGHAASLTPFKLDTLRPSPPCSRAVRGLHAQSLDAASLAPETAGPARGRAAAESRRRAGGARAGRSTRRRRQKTCSTSKVVIN